jgi:TorA maturation chaperone TorD
MPVELTVEREVAMLLRRAALFRTLALAFADPRRVDPASVAQALEGLGPDAHAALWAELWQAATFAWRTVQANELAAEHTRLFQGPSPCPPHETAYGDSRRIGGRQAELADICGFYQAFGVGPAARARDLPDHLATELEFYALLLLKIAYALARNMTEAQEITERAAKAFLEDHLGRWPGAFCQRLEAYEATSPYPESARLIEAVLEEECARLDASPLPVEGFAAPAEPEVVRCPLAAVGAPRWP